MKIEDLIDDFDPEETSFLSTTDPRLAEIAGHAQHRRFVEAASQVSALLDAHIHDIRVMPYYFYRHFEEHGLLGLATVFRAFARVLGRHWKHFGPERNKEHHGEVALGWLARTVIKELKHHEKFKDETYRRWIDDVRESGLADVLVAAGELRAAAADELEEPQSLEVFQRCVHWLETIDRLMRDGEDPMTQASEGTDDAPEAESSTPAPVARAGAADAPMIEGSDKLKELLIRLDVFARLIEREEYFKASLVALDVERRLENFDPMAYFPKIFSTYTRLMSQHVGTISSYWECEDSMAWKATNKFYDVDLASFIEVEIPPPHPGD